jgi:beta-galactosidase
MRREFFNSGWRVRLQGSQTDEAVTLPHDAMLGQKRLNDGTTLRDKAFFLNGVWEYTKTFFAPNEYGDKHLLLEFEGVYNRSQVYVNDCYAGGRPYGYSEFSVDLDGFLKYGQENTIKVIARSSDDSRWYSGAGIYRPVSLLTSGPVFIDPRSPRITTPEITAEGTLVRVETVIRNISPRAKVRSRFRTAIYDQTGLMAGEDSMPVTVFRGEDAIVIQRIFIREAKLWDVDSPCRYTCRSSLAEDGTETDTAETAFGIRKLSLDRERGLQINGRTVKLRGACIHHDNGVIGAAGIARAEERRIEKLKAAGFNAIRSAHHPASRALLEACDRIGMFVMDEAFDMWTEAKRPFDYSLDFGEWWDRDIEAMIAKDYNHPGVIIYSTGNEIPEAGTIGGSVIGRRIAQKIRHLDNTRFTTNAINPLMMQQFKQIIAEASKKAEEEGIMPASDISEAGTEFAADYAKVMTGREIAEATEESFASVDMAGYNYLDIRYESDGKLYPNRIIIGTETYPRNINRNWRLVQDNSHVIGDFTWTGWDYIGEAGIGKVHYSIGRRGLNIFGEYPWLLAWCGDMDITGQRRPASYYREIVFGLRKAPYIAVQRLEHYHDRAFTLPWGWSDSLAGWSWTGYEGKPVKVEVYSDAEEVELLLNGASLGKQQTGEGHNFKAEFDTLYQPGRLEAVACSGGREQSRHVLESAAGEVRLEVNVDRETINANDRDLAFVEIALTDSSGNIWHNLSKKVSLTVKGPGTLQGLGNGNPVTEEPFTGVEHTTFNGRALAVIRPTGPGEILVTLEADGCKAVTVKLNVQICTKDQD